ncbi:LOW QUALITY PROTEIN: hypothetical protein PHMEG_00016367 [Phytophthora megakarya]|uniref:Peptidase A2 domain-containing protein n=1 Tax=Phytophthora megakarya TaxID=4795 RepID=A0A225VZH3_9STRA|nr:LOW QUALITY PROTEIN: hypothetical protein PHMEG_00016367 [Phytophthora megakarya]
MDGDPLTLNISVLTNRFQWSNLADDLVEVGLGPGQRYGWWEDQAVCRAITDRRTRIFLDTGASVNIVSLDLACRLSLKIRTHRQIKVSALGGIPTYISAHARVKITLVVYLQDVWIGNVDVLLGMNFMYSGGVRLCSREGLVKLPDEENVVMYDDVPRKQLPAHAKESVYLRPGEAAVVKIEYGQTNPQ